MSSRDSILSSIREHSPESVPLPRLDGPWIRFDDPAAQFAEVLQAVGGRCCFVGGVGELNRELEQLPAYAEAKKRVSLVTGAGVSDIDLETIEDPHTLEDVDFALLPGIFGVAENAAVWVTDEALKHRVLYFLCQHLALVIPAGAIVQNMHEAYERLAFPDQGFGAFISGPSKTADIEQALVIGAHGPRSLTVFVVGPLDSD